MYSKFMVQMHRKLKLGGEIGYFHKVKCFKEDNSVFLAVQSRLVTPRKHDLEGGRSDFICYNSLMGGGGVIIIFQYVVLSACIGWNCAPRTDRIFMFLHQIY